MRWEQTRHMPVHRLPGGSAVYALKSELDAWRTGAGIHLSLIIEDTIGQYLKQKPDLRSKAVFQEACSKVRDFFTPDKILLKIPKHILKEGKIEEYLSTWNFLIRNEASLQLDKEFSQVENLPEKLQLIPCFQYALFKAGIAPDREEEGKFYGEGSIVQILPFLENRGMRITQMPKEGDLALFFQNDKLVHMGVYMGKGKICSKEGAGVRYVCTRALDDLPSQYGDQILYYGRLR